MTGSPYVLAGVVIVTIAIVVGIVATIRARSEASPSYSPPAGPAYEPEETADASPVDISKLQALLGGSATESDRSEGIDEAYGAEAEPRLEAESAARLEAEPEPEAHAISLEELPPVVVDVPEREDEPLSGLWAHLVATEEGPLVVQDRLDMVTRLEMVGEKWCVDALNSAVSEEQDPQVNAAVRAALSRLTP